MHLGDRDTSGYTQGVAASGDQVYVADFSALVVVDVANPCPQIVGHLDTSDAWEVAVSGSYAYVADRSAGLRVINISAPESPAHVGSVLIPPAAVGVAVAGGFDICHRR